MLNPFVQRSVTKNGWGSHCKTPRAGEFGSQSAVGQPHFQPSRVEFDVAVVGATCFLQDQELTLLGIVAPLTFQTWDVTLPQAGRRQVQPPQSIFSFFRNDYTLPTAESSVEVSKIPVLEKLPWVHWFVTNLFQCQLWGNDSAKPWKPFLHLHMPNNTHDTFPHHIHVYTDRYLSDTNRLVCKCSGGNCGFW